MIQRVQSLFLLGVVISLLATLYFPIWQKIDVDQQSGVILKAYATEVHQASQGIEVVHLPAVIVAILIIIGILVAIFEIFQFRNRLNQIKLGALNSLVMAGALGLCVYLTFRLEQTIPAESQGEYELGMYLPAIALIFNLLANRFIRKDHELVRSVDRIR